MASLESCSMCNYHPKPKNPQQLAWLMKRHYLTNNHLAKSTNNGGFYLCDEGLLEYYTTRVPYVEDMNIRETYLGHIETLKQKIANRTKDLKNLEAEGIKMGYTNV